MSSSLVSGAAVNTTAAPGGFDDICALSPLQQEVLSDPNHADYAEQALWTNDLPLDGELLKRSWDLLAQRHPILRTLFRRARKQPVQIIRAHAQVSLVLHNFNHEPEAKQQEMLQQTIQQELALPFDLAKGPLFRVCAFRFFDNSFQTLLTFHPILMDRRTVEMVHREVSAIYAALLNGEVPPEHDASTVKDFILWLKRQDPAEASRYWEQYIAGVSATHFPADHPQGTGDQNHAKRHISLAQDLTVSLKKLAAQCDVGVPAVLQTAWALLLGRYTGVTEVTFGLALDGRPAGLGGSETIAGRFAHTLPVSVRFEAGENLTGLLHAVQQQIININRYSYLPLSQVGAAAGVLPPGKLFNTVFKEAASIVGDQDTSHVQFLCGQTGYDTQPGLTVEVAEGTAIHISVNFQEAVFESATIESLLASFRQLVASMAADPQALVTDLEILPVEERMRVLAFAQGDVVNDQELWQRLGVAKPRSTSKVYVLEQQRLAPVGCPGEVAIGGIADAGEAAGGTERFILNPFASDEGNNLYLTGHQGRWKWNGSLELLAEPDIQGNADVDTPNGYVAPVTEMEKLVAQVWQEVLGVSPVGLNDDFFDLGGHSLNTIQIRSRLSQSLGINVPLKTIFANPSLEAQAGAVAALTTGPAKAGAGIPRLPQKKYYPVSHAQRRLWFLHRLDPDDRFYHTADYILLEGPLDRPAFEQAFHALVERQEILRTSFTLIADEPVQCISENTLTIPFHDLSGLGQEEQTQTMKRLQDEVPNWLSNLEVPPVGALLVKLADDKHVFILAIHHILSDEWSGQVVWRDLMELYSAACRKQSPRLPQMRIRYADFAVWQKERIEGESWRNPSATGLDVWVAS